MKKLNNSKAKILQCLRDRSDKIQDLRPRTGLPISTFTKEFNILWKWKYVKSEKYFRYLSGVGLVALQEWEREQKRISDGTPKELFK